MPAVPEISWKRLSVEELKHYYENDSKEHNEEETKNVVALVHLVELGEVRAFQKPDGTIMYQYDPKWETNK